MQRMVALVMLASGVASIASPQAGPPAPADRPAAVAPPSRSQTPGAADTATKPLHGDVDKAIATLVARMLEMPRFEEHVEVRDRYQGAIDAHLCAAGLTCGATGQGPPGDAEMERFRETRIPPHADLLAGAKWVNRRLKGLFAAGKARYFVYAVRRDSPPGRVVYVVRDGPISEDARSSVPGTRWELVGGFADRSKAAKALERMERRLPDERADAREASPTLWAVPRCGR